MRVKCGKCSSAGSPREVGANHSVGVDRGIFRFDQGIEFGGL